MKLFVLVCCVALLVCSGCAGHCLTLEGGYQEWNGGLTWCVDKAQSQAANQPVVKNEAGLSAILVSEQEAVVITEILAKEAQTGSPFVRASSVSNFAEFTLFLREIMQKNSDQQK